jgi:hypothetical protein
MPRGPRANKPSKAKRKSATTTETTEASNKRKPPPTPTPIPTKIQKKGEGRLKDDDDFASQDDSDDDNNLTDSEESPISPSRAEKTKKRVPSNKKSKTSATQNKEDKEAELVKENEALRSQLHKQSRAEKEKKAIEDEDDLVSIKLGRFIKEVLWKRCKFITSDATLLKAMNVCARHFGIEEREKTEWRLRHMKKVQKNINGRRNNCAQDVEKAYKRKLKSRSPMVFSSSINSC